MSVEGSERARAQGAPWASMDAESHQRRLGARLREAAAKNDVAGLREVLSLGAEIESKTSAGVSAATVAAQFGSLEALAELMRAGAAFAPAPREVGQCSAFTAAIENFQIEALRLVVDFSLTHPPQLSSQEQWNALDMEIRHTFVEMAAVHGCPEAVPLLALLARSQARHPFYASAICAFIRRGRMAMALELWRSLEQPHAKAHARELVEKEAALIEKSASMKGTISEHGARFQEFAALLERLDLEAAVGVAVGGGSGRL